MKDLVKVLKSQRYHGIKLTRQTISYIAILIRLFLS